MAKKTFKKEQILVIYEALKTAKLKSGADRRKLADILREMRPVVKAHDEDMEMASETLKPAGLDEIKNRIKDGVAITQLDMIRSQILTEEYNESRTKYNNNELDKDVEIEMPSSDEEFVDKLIESNPDWTPEQIMVVIDVLG